MSVITLTDYTPLERYDAVAWTHARLEEATLADGPWTQIELFTLSPVDADPANPATHTFTTDNGTLDEGWYRIVWIDAQADESVTPAVLNPPDRLPYQPLVNDVASDWLRARTRDVDGKLAGKFTANTTPTYEQAYRVVRTAAREVQLAVGPVIPTELIESARGVVSLLAAMKIELSFFPEQIRPGNSAYNELKDLYDDGKGGGALPKLIVAVQRVGEQQGVDPDVTAGMPVLTIPIPPPRVPGAEFPSDFPPGTLPPFWPPGFGGPCW